MSLQSIGSLQGGSNSLLTKRSREDAGDSSPSKKLTARDHHEPAVDERVGEKGQKIFAELQESTNSSLQDSQDNAVCKKIYGYYQKSREAKDSEQVVLLLQEALSLMAAEGWDTRKLSCDSLCVAGIVLEAVVQSVDPKEKAAACRRSLDYWKRAFAIAPEKNLETISYRLLESCCNLSRASDRPEEKELCYKAAIELEMQKCIDGQKSGGAHRLCKIGGMLFRIFYEADKAGISCSDQDKMGLFGVVKLYFEKTLEAIQALENKAEKIEIMRSLCSFCVQILSSYSKFFDATPLLCTVVGALIRLTANLEGEARRLVVAQALELLKQMVTSCPGELSHSQLYWGAESAWTFTNGVTKVEQKVDLKQRAHELYYQIARGLCRDAVSLTDRLNAARSLCEISVDLMQQANRLALPPPHISYAVTVAKELRFEALNGKKKYLLSKAFLQALDAAEKAEAEWCKKSIDTVVVTSEGRKWMAQLFQHPHWDRSMLEFDTILKELHWN